MRKILEVKNLSVEAKENGEEILKNISFYVEERSIYVLIGPNGAGKSTLAYALMGIPRFKIASGKIVFKNKDITKFPTYKRAKLGMTLSFQDPAFFEGVTVENFLRAGNKNISQKELKKTLSLVGLDAGKFLSRKINHLSGGERKRVEFASVAVMRPKLMILDEPDSGLDIVIYKEFYDILDNIREETKASIVLITHREEVGFIANRAGFLYKGRMAYEGDFREAMRKYCQTVNRRKLCKFRK